jgi:hypothetical protein
MKLNVLKNTAIAFISLCTVMSCVKDDDYELPDNKKVLPAFTGKVVSFSDVASRTTTSIKTYSGDEAIEGYVISSDEGGNFYKKIYIQNEDKTQALSVALDKSGIYTEFPIGAKVQLRLKGLTTQLNNAITEVGYKIYKNEKSGRESVGSMAEAIYKTHLYDMGGERKTLASLAKEVTSIETVKNDAHVGQLITLKGVHFPNEVVGKTMYDKNKDLGGATNYKLTDANGKTIDFRTSSYAKFKDEKVPSGTLDVTGVLSKFNTSWQFMVSNYADIKVVSSATTTSTQTSTQTATTVVSLEASTATVADYVVGKHVKLHGIITVKSSRTYITFKDGTEIQVYAPREVTISQAAKDKLLMAGYEIAVTGVFTDFALKNGTVVKEIVYSKESDIEFIKAPATVPQITTLDAATATAADFTNNIGKKVKLTGTITEKAKKSYIKFSDGTEIQLYIAGYGNLDKSFKDKMKQGTKITITGEFSEYGKDKIKQLTYKAITDVEFK